MRGLPLLLAGLLLAAGLAGCVGDDTQPDASGAQADPASQGPSSSGQDQPAQTTASLSHCVGYSVQAPLPWDAVADALPPGFEPAPFVPVHVGPITLTEDRAAEGFFDGWRCSAASVGNASLGEVTFVFAKIEVDPPSELAPPDGGASYIPLFLASEAPRLVEAFRGWGLAAGSDEPTVETLGAGPARTGHVQGSTPNATLETRVALVQTPATTISASADETRYFVTDPPLFQGEAEVTGVIERSTTNVTGTMGGGHLEITGPVAEALGPRHAGLGFDSSDGSWGETFRYRPVEAVG